MRKRIIGILVSVLCIVWVHPVLGCTVFLVSDGDRVFAGNNEDFDDPNIRMYVFPPEGDNNGYVMFGYRDLPLQGGVNDRGLFYDGLALCYKPVTRSADKPRFKGNIIETVMTTCSTVDEVVEIFEGYDRSYLEHAQLMFGDQSGDSVIIEGDAIVRKDGDYQVATNFRHSTTDQEDICCPRYIKACEKLEKSSRANVRLCRKVLDAVHAEGQSSTLYSNVYDLKKNIIYLYLFHDYKHGKKLLLKDLFKQGKKIYELPSLFALNEEYQAFKTGREDEYRAKLDRIPPLMFDETYLDDFTGQYVMEEKGQRATLAVTKENRTLIIERTDDNPYGQIFKVHPELEDRFIYITMSSILSKKVLIQFNRNDQGEVVEMVVNSNGMKMHAKKTG